MKASSLLAPIARRLEGKVAVITSDARGIRATVCQFLGHGAKVVITDIEDKLAYSLCNDIDDQSSLSYSEIHCDITKILKSSIHTEKLDIMYAKAGISAYGEDETKVLSAGNEVFKNVMNVNVYGSFLTAKHTVRAMIPAKRDKLLWCVRDICSYKSEDEVNTKGQCQIYDNSCEELVS